MSMLACQYSQPKRPGDLDLWPCSGVQITCDVGYLCANFSLPRPLRSRLRPDVRNRPDIRQTDVRQHHRLMPPVRGHNNSMTKYHTDQETAAGKAQRYRTDLDIACHDPYDESTRKFNRKKYIDDGRMTYWTKSMTKYCTDRQIQAETGRHYRTDPEINLFTACHAVHDESTRKFNRKKFTDDGQTTYWTKQRWNTAYRINFWVSVVATSYFCLNLSVGVVFRRCFVQQVVCPSSVIFAGCISASVCH